MKDMPNITYLKVQDAQIYSNKYKRETPSRKLKLYLNSALLYQNSYWKK